MDPRSIYADSIPFTQYHRPDGRKSPLDAPVPEGWNAKVATFLKAGIVFTCEVLRNNIVALYAQYPGDDFDFATELSANDDSVNEALVTLLGRCESELEVRKAA